MDEKFKKKLNSIFAAVVALCLIVMGYIYYKDTQFDQNPLSKEIKNEIAQKQKSLKKIVKQKYKIDASIPILISDKMNHNLYGLAAYDNGDIKIILNKKRFKESKEYMIDYVLPHEYAHALMFVFGDFSRQNGGHTEKWQRICLDIGGKKCDRFVDHQDVVIGKIKF